jgi:hypothetical protein
MTLSNDERIVLEDKLKELMAKKKKITKKMETMKKKYIKTGSERKHINLEIKAIGEQIRKMLASDPISARKHVLEKIEEVETSEMFPADLEKEFDTLDKKCFKRKSTVVKVDDYLVGESEVILGGNIGDIEEEFKEVEASDGTEEEDNMIPKYLDDDNEVGFDDDDVIISEGVDDDSPDKAIDGDGALDDR